MVDTTSGYVTLEWQQWLQNPDFVTVAIDTPLPVASGGTGQATDILAQLEMSGPIYPALPVDQTSGSVQVVVGLWAGDGVPDDAGGQNGHYYFRGDGTVGSNVYKKTAGLWGAIL